MIYSLHVAYRDLRYSAFCVSRITAEIWLDTILYHDICKIHNVSLFLWKVDLSLSTQLTSWQLCGWVMNMDCLSLQFWFKNMYQNVTKDMHHSAYIVIIALSILWYSWNTVSRYDTQSLYQYIAILICITDP